MRIYYGILTNFIDVTEICFHRLRNNHIITIPSGDSNRAIYFGDPIYGKLKKIFLEDGDNTFIYEEFYKIIIDLQKQTLSVVDEKVLNESDKTIIDMNPINQKLVEIHSKLKLIHGTMNDELPEQKMSVHYLTGNEKVLEIGGNVGRNTLVISSILKDSSNLVSLECDPVSAKQLRENRDANGFKFHVEESALSERKLIQRGWDTIPSDTLLEGYQWVNTITLDGLKNKYNIEFDTLVLDCEGAFYHILMDMPQILYGINLIIMENDYDNITKKKYVDEVLTSHGFYRDFLETKPWGHRTPCDDCFFEVWKK